MSITHVALDYDPATGVGKISGKKWKAEHTIVNLSSCSALTLFFEGGTGKSYTPGDTLLHNIDPCKTRIAANHLQPIYWRIMSYAGGDETTANDKTIRVDNAESYITVSWTASGEGLRVSGWQEWDSSLTDQQLQVSYQAGSATETLTIFNIGVEFRYG